jgi:hypothetical protein
VDDEFESWPVPIVATYIRHRDGAISIRHDSWHGSPTYSIDLETAIEGLGDLGDYLFSHQFDFHSPAIVRWEQE